MDIINNLKQIEKETGSETTVVAVSKMKPSGMVKELFEAGYRDFGENKVQDLLSKYEELPKEIRWHMIGHLQTNKVKYIAPFVHLIHGVDSFKLLKTINKEGRKNERVLDCLLQIHISEESTKFGLDETELMDLLQSDELPELGFIRIRGLMGMATFTDDSAQVRAEFKNLKRIFDQVKESRFNNQDGFDLLSMGMSGDYKLALEEGSNMVRIGSLIFGERNYT